MRILIVLRYFYCPSRPVGGAERQALKLAERLIGKGVAVTIVTGLWDWGQPRREKINGVPVHRNFTGWGMFNIRGLRKFGQYLYLLTLFLYLLRHRNDYDLIHSHSARFGASMVVQASKLVHKKALVRAMSSGAWGDITTLREERSIRGTRWMLRKLGETDCAVALNEQVIRELVEIGVKPEKIVRIPNGVEIDRVKPRTDYLLGQPVTVIFVGRFHPKKGVDTLLLAWQKVQKDMPQLAWRLRLVGKGGLEQEMEAMARRLSIDQTVEFCGQVDDPFPLLRQSDIFVLPSSAEGMSNALLEAMAHGLPCIVTDIAGNNEVIQHEQNGLLVRPNDERDLAHAIARLAADQALRERLGLGALRAVENGYSIDSVADRYIALYAGSSHSEGTTTNAR
jgi:glycosyltransferase involved in cell wall biosynthesis